MREYGGYNFVSKGCGVLLAALLVVLFGLSVGVPVAIALAW